MLSLLSGMGDEGRGKGEEEEGGGWEKGEGRWEVGKQGNKSGGIPPTEGTVCTSFESGLPSFSMSATDFSSGSFICWGKIILTSQHKRSVPPG